MGKDPQIEALLYRVDALDDLVVTLCKALHRRQPENLAALAAELSAEQADNLTEKHRVPIVEHQLELLRQAGL